MTKTWTSKGILVLILHLRKMYEIEQRKQIKHYDVSTH